MSQALFKMLVSKTVIPPPHRPHMLVEETETKINHLVNNGNYPL